MEMRFPADEVEVACRRTRLTGPVKEKEKLMWYIFEESCIL